MRKLRILQVTPFFYPATLATGPANISREQSKELVLRGHDVSVYASNTCDSSSGLDIGKTASVDDITVYYCASVSHKLAATHRIVLCPQLLQLARRQVATFDIVHLHDYRTFNNLIVSIFAKKAGVPYVLQPHGTVPRLVEKFWLKGLFDVCFGRWMLRNATRLVASSPMGLEQGVDAGVRRQRIVVLPNGAKPPASVLPEAGKLFREQYEIGSQDLVILFLGRIHKIKGLDLLLQAFGRLLERLAAVKLVIAGPDDEYLSTLTPMLHSLQLEQSVIFTGNLPGQAKWSALQASDVLVLPSLYDAFPLSVLEAWSMGLPVIVTPRNGLADWVQRGAGIVASRDQGVLANALFELLTDPDKRRTFGEMGKKLVEQHFTWERVVDRLEQMYYNVIEEAGEE